MRKLFSLRRVYAHCDIPCGIYDPHTAEIAALTVLRMLELIGESKDAHDISRYTAVKEEHTERCKREIIIIWGDFFKAEDLNIENFKRKYDLFGKKIIFFGGRLSILKGGEKIIIAMGRIIKDVPNAILLMTGNIEVEVLAMLNIAEKGNFRDKIITSGWLSGDELKAAYFSSDVVVVPYI